MATDHNGDAVVVWTRTDTSLRRLGQSRLPIRKTGIIHDRQQHLRPLPHQRGAAGGVAGFAVHGPVECDVIPTSRCSTAAAKFSSRSRSPTPNPGGPTTFPATFQLGIDLNGDGQIDPATEKTDLIMFDEANWDSSDPNAELRFDHRKDLEASWPPRAAIRTAFCRTLRVRTIDSRNFMVTYQYPYEPTMGDRVPAFAADHRPGFH